MEKYFQNRSWRRLVGLLGPLGGVLGASWGPLGSLLGASWGHSEASGGVGLRKAKISYVRICLRWVLEPSWSHFGAVLGPSCGHLGAIFGLSWEVLGCFRTVWGRLGAVWNCLGAILSQKRTLWGHLGLSWAVLGPSVGHLGTS